MPQFLTTIAAANFAKATMKRLVGNVQGLAVDLAVLQCRAGREKDCLTAAQVQAVKNIYGPPMTSRGEVLSSRGVLPGSELEWSESFAETWGDIYFTDTGLLSVPGRKWTYRDFDFDRDYARSGAGLRAAAPGAVLEVGRATGSVGRIDFT